MATTPTMTTLTNAYELTMFFSTDVAGWSEKLLLKETTNGAALTQAQLVLAWRRHLLPFNADIVYARVHDLAGNARLAAAVLDKFPVAGDFGYVTVGPEAETPEDEPDKKVFGVNSTRDALLIRMESTNWDWSIRYLHGVPDPILSNDEPTKNITVAALPTTLTQFEATNWEVRAGQYLAIIKANCKIMGYGPIVAPATERSLLGAEINRLTVRKATGRKVGRPFGGPRGRAIPR